MHINTFVYRAGWVQGRYDLWQQFCWGDRLQLKANGAAELSEAISDDLGLSVLTFSSNFSN